MNLRRRALLLALPLLAAACATAATGEDPRDPALASRLYARPGAEVWRAVLKIAAETRDWELVRADKEGLRVEANHYTKLWRFRDEVEVTIREEGGRSRVDARSTSVIGLGDMGQNRRNLIELLTLLDGAMAAPPSAAPAPGGGPGG